MGAVARLAKNFGVDRISIVRPRASLGQEARRRAMAGLPLLKAARVVESFDEAVDDCRPRGRDHRPLYRPIHRSTSGGL